MRILVTGATGYIGGRLVPVLLEAGHSVRCLVRSPEKLNDVRWRNEIEVVEGDVLDPDSLRDALSGCDAAYYLIHSMDGGNKDFRDQDRIAAKSFRNAADLAGLRRVVYLGGLGQGVELSKHLSSRQEVGALLANGNTPVTELRAGVIIGSGSVSFEMLRYLTEVLPAMVTPKWVRTKCQPLAVADALRILAAAIEETGPEDHIYEIGGPDQISYEQMMRQYAEVAGLRPRKILPLPVLSPKLSSHWVGLVTPLPTRVAKPLVESLRNEVVVADNSYAEGIVKRLVPYRSAVGDALQRSMDPTMITRLSEATKWPAQPSPSDPPWAGGTELMNTQLRETSVRAEDLFWAFSRIGGDVGYYTFGWAWAIRGYLDSMIGGVGLRRGRRHSELIRTGDEIDFWRVERVTNDRVLRLRAEMKLPGQAWLTFEAVPRSEGATLRQTAMFIPRGLMGRLYWLALLPFHRLIFTRMADGVVRSAGTRPNSARMPSPVPRA